MKKGRISEAQARVRKKRCVWIVPTRQEKIYNVAQGGVSNVLPFLGVQKVYDIVWTSGLREQASKYGGEGDTWRVLKEMAESAKAL